MKWSYWFKLGNEGGQEKPPPWTCLRVSSFQMFHSKNLTLPTRSVRPCTIFWVQLLLILSLICEERDRFIWRTWR